MTSTTGILKFEDELRNLFFKEIEAEIKLFSDGQSIVENARLSTKSANEYTSKFYIGWILNPIREKLDPFASAFFLAHPRFSHDSQMKIAQKDLNDGSSQSNKHKMASRNIAYNDYFDHYTYGRMANFVGCSENTYIVKSVQENLSFYDHARRARHLSVNY